MPGGILVAAHSLNLYDEPMQKEQYGIPENPDTEGVKPLFEWVLGREVEDDKLIPLSLGLRVPIIARAL